MDHRNSLYTQWAGVCHALLWFPVICRSSFLLCAPDVDVRIHFSLFCSTTFYPWSGGSPTHVLDFCPCCLCCVCAPPQLPPGWIQSVVDRVTGTSCFVATGTGNSLSGLPFRTGRYFPQACAPVDCSSHAGIGALPDSCSP